MPPKIDIEEVRRLIEKELEPINEKLASLEEKYNTLSQTADFASAKYDQILKQLNNNNNNELYLKNHKVYNTLYPANSYNSNLGRTKIINKGVIKLHKKKGKEKKYSNTQKENNPTHKLKHWGFVIRKKD